MVKVMLCGMTDVQNAAGLLPLARSWLRPPEVRCLSDSWQLEGYDLTERAFVVRAAEGDKPRAIILQFDASESSPLVNPAVLAKGWGDGPARLKINGHEFPHDNAAFRCGYRQSLTSTDLVVWIQKEQMAPCLIEITPRGVD